MISIVNEMLSIVPIQLEKINKEDIDKEILRAAIIGELDAINLYEQMAARAADIKVKKLLLDIAKEEKTHVGELESLLAVIDKEQKEESIKGAKEVKNLLS
jgi:rubrerythrin